MSVSCVRFLLSLRSWGSQGWIASGSPFLSTFTCSSAAFLHRFEQHPALVASADSRSGQNREVLDDINRMGNHQKTTRYNEARQLQTPGQEWR